MLLDRTESVAAEIHSHQDGVPWIGPTWPTSAGFAYILCPDCGEIDEDGEFFAPNTCYSNMDYCNVCKGKGFMCVAI